VISRRLPCRSKFLSPRLLLLELKLAGGCHEKSCDTTGSAIIPLLLFFLATDLVSRPTIHAMLLTEEAI